MTRCESYPLCSGTIYFPTAPFVYGYYFLSTYFSTGLIPIFSKDSLNGS